MTDIKKCPFSRQVQQGVGLIRKDKGCSIRETHCGYKNFAIHVPDENIVGRCC